MTDAPRRAVLAGLPVLAAASAALAARAGEPQAGVPISLPGLRHVLCDARLSGRPVRTVIDTGAGRATLSARLAAELGLALRPGRTVRGLTGEARVSTTGPVSLAIGPTRLELADADVADLGPLVRSQGFEVDAIVGRDLFDRFGVRFDFAARRMWIGEAGTGAPAGAGWRRLPLGALPGGGRVVPADVEGHALAAELDLGSDAPVYIAPEACRRLRLLASRRVSTTLGAGLEGVGVEQIFTLDNLALAGWALHAPPARVPAAWTFEPELVLGLPVLRRFDLDVRFPRGELWLRPSAAGFAQPFRKDRSGIAAGWTGTELRIAFVAPNSPAASAGLKPGDVIAAVNGQPVDAAFMARGVRMGAGPAGARLVLDLDGARRVALELRDYY